MLTKPTYFFILLLISSISCHGQQNSNSKPYYYKDLLVDIREQNLTPTEALAKFKELIEPYRNKYADLQVDSLDVKLVFPLRSRNYRAVGGNGSGFYARQFNLFDHTISKSHPAHDIFIYDRNRDCIDDRDGDYVDVVAVGDGEVIATETNWHEGDAYKGGNYVWIFDFQTGGLWYYAHLREVYVRPGQQIKAGDKLGEVGRTGFNALSNRSDTHLHLMHLHINEDLSPRPINHYEWLKNAKTIYTTQIPVYRPLKDIEVARIQPKLQVNLAGYTKTKTQRLGLKKPKTAK